MFDCEVKNYDIQIDEIFGREGKELQEILKDCKVGNKYIYNNCKFPSKTDSNFLAIPTEVDLDCLETILNKLIFINNTSSNTQKYTLTDNFIKKYTCDKI